VQKGDLFAIGGKHDLVIGNPDFGIAERVVRHGIAHLNPGGHVAMLLRLTILGSETRVPFHREHPLRYLQPIAQRPAFKRRAGRPTRPSTACSSGSRASRAAGRSCRRWCGTGDDPCRLLAVRLPPEKRSGASRPHRS
jgi:hypothetical protein